MEAFFDSLSAFWQSILSIIRDFEWKDAVDIIIVAFIIYGAIKLLRETRAGQLVKGLVFLVAAYIISTNLNLMMLGQILAYFFQFAFIAVIIVFQPEIRKALEQMGRSNVGRLVSRAVSGKDRMSSQAETLHAIDSVVDATAILQQMRMGALIVFEKDTKLHEIVATGTIVDAAPNAQLISNIFFNKAPLHDGAMILRDGRVLAAGCILPLTHSGSLNVMLGTRHRAALGMSEDSDAVVVIVSEETGQISIAEKGVLTRNYSRVTLRDMLKQRLLEENDNKKSGNIFSKISFGFKKRRAERDE